MWGRIPSRASARMKLNYGTIKLNQPKKCSLGQEFRAFPGCTGAVLSKSKGDKSLIGRRAVLERQIGNVIELLPMDEFLSYGRSQSSMYLLTL